ncbi:hypothetical protein ACYQR9_15450 [Methylobacterium sp. CM6241]
MTALDLKRWRRETGAVDRLVDGLLARDGAEQAAAVREISDDNEAHARIWARTLLLVAWHADHGED